MPIQWFDNVNDIYTYRGTPIAKSTETRDRTRVNGHSITVFDYIWSYTPRPIYLNIEPSQVVVRQPYYVSFNGSNKGVRFIKEDSGNNWNFSVGYADNNGNWVNLYDYSEGFGSRGGRAMVCFADISKMSGAGSVYNWIFCGSTTSHYETFVSEYFNSWYVIYTDYNENNNWYKDFEPYVPTPIKPNKDNDGNQGDYNNDSDIINLPELPTISAINNGMIHAYLINQTQLTELGNYLWSTDFFDNFIKLFDNPMDAILGLYQCKYTPTTGNTQEIKVGNCLTGVNGLPILTNYHVVNCGSISLKEYFGNALDYSPFTKTITIYLPYVGFRELDVDVAMSSTLTVIYYIDVVSGSGVAYVYVSKSLDGTDLQAPIYSYPCSVNAQIPLTAYNMTALYSSIVGGISAIAGGIATGGASGVASATIGTANSIMGAKNMVEKNGSVTGMSGLLGIQKPFISIERPINAYAEDYNVYNGLPCNMTYTLSSMSGFTKVSNIKLSIDTATEEEKKMIEELLKEGVYI